jgi:hypothetical protein
MVSMIPYINNLIKYDSSEDYPQKLTAANEQGR